jgi:hypothetical protein
VDAYSLELARDLYLDLLKDVLTGSVYDESAWTVINFGKQDWRSAKRPFRFLSDLIKRVIVKGFQKKSILLVKKNPFVAETREKGRDWPLIGYTMVGRRRLDNVQACVEEVLRNGVPGDFIETGTWRGGTTIFMRALLKPIFDSLILKALVIQSVGSAAGV